MSVAYSKEEEASEEPIRRTSYHDEGEDLQPNAYEARENMAVGGGKNASQMFMEEEGAADGEEKQPSAKPKREFLKKKNKYDPRKAIEDSKQKQEEYSN